MRYTPHTVPLRSPMYDDQARLTRPWHEFLEAVARKSGRSALWRGVYDATMQYAVCDVVRTADNGLYICLQPQPINGRTISPGTDDTVWELLYRQTAIVVHSIPAGGTTDQVLTKLSDDDYDVDWVDAAAGGAGTGTVTHTGGALTADLPIFGAGADDVKTGTKSGNTNKLATVSGALTAGHALTTDASGNVVDGGAAAVALPIAESDVTGLVADLAAKAPLASPALTGNPTAPTPTAGDNDTSIATTAFVTAAVAASLPIAEASVTGLVADLAAKVPTTRSIATTSPLTGGGDLSADRTISLGTQTANQVLAGPTTGAAAAPAFRALVAADIPAIAESGVTSLVADLALKAPLASPALTGTPTAPTAAAGTSTTQIATTAFVEGEIGPGGGGAYFAHGGDGSDGALVYDGATTILTVAPSSSVYALTRDIFATNLTINAGVTIKTQNYAIFCTGTFTCNGTVHNDGQAASNGSTAVSSTGGNGGAVGIRTSNVAGNDGHYARLLIPVAGTAGGNGGTTTGSVATSASGGTGIAGRPIDLAGSAGSAGSAGGKGGTGTGGAGGAARAGGSAGTAFASLGVQSAREPSAAVTGVTFTSSSVFLVQASNAGNGAAPGGSGGGGDTTNSGGGGGGGGGEGGSGGVVGIFAHTITIGAAGIIRANGGTGGNGGNGRTPTTGNCGGGGGGAGGSGGVGGIVWLVYHRYTNAGTVQASGGTHGTGGTKGSPHGTGTDDAANGVDGPDGPNGNVITIPC